MYINFICPPLPHLIWSGTALYRSGDKHEKRNLSQTFDLIVVQSGRLYMQEEERRYALERGDYLILSSDTNHKGYQCCEGDTFFYWTHFYTFGDYIVTEALPGRFRRTRFSLSKLYKTNEFYLSIPKYGSISELNLPFVEKNLRTLSQFEVNRFMASSKSTEATMTPLEQQRIFLSVISTISTLGGEQKSKPNIATLIQQHLSENYAEPFDLQKLAKEYNFHPGYIIRSVKKQYGQSPLQLLLSIRIERAKQLFGAGPYSVNSVSEMVGFETPAYFSRQFKKLTGMSPTEYKNSPYGYK